MICSSAGRERKPLNPDAGYATSGIHDVQRILRLLDDDVLAAVVVVMLKRNFEEYQFARVTRLIPSPPTTCRKE